MEDFSWLTGAMLETAATTDERLNRYDWMGREWTVGWYSREGGWIGNHSGGTAGWD